MLSTCPRTTTTSVIRANEQPLLAEPRAPSPDGGTGQEAWDLAGSGQLGCPIRSSAKWPGGWGRTAERPDGLATSSGHTLEARRTSWVPVTFQAETVNPGGKKASWGACETDSWAPLRVGSEVWGRTRDCLSIRLPGSADPLAWGPPFKQEAGAGRVSQEQTSK